MNVVYSLKIYHKKNVLSFPVISNAAFEIGPIFIHIKSPHIYHLVAFWQNVDILPGTNCRNGHAKNCLRFGEMSPRNFLARSTIQRSNLVTDIKNLSLLYLATSRFNLLV